MGAPLVYGEPPACMGNGNPTKSGNMKAGRGLQTLRIFGNIGGIGMDGGCGWYGICRNVWGRRFVYGEPPACMGNGNPTKSGNMKAGRGLQTLRIFGNIGGSGSWVWG